VHELMLLAAGGMVPIAPEIQRSLAACFDLALPEADRLAHVARTFFADARDATSWRDGWYPEVAAFQGDAIRATPVDDWWLGGGKEVLILQPERQGHSQDAASDDGDFLASAVRLNLLGHNNLPGLGSIGPAEAAACRPSAGSAKFRAAVLKVGNWKVPATGSFNPGTYSIRYYAVRNRARQGWYL